MSEIYNILSVKRLYRKNFQTQWQRALFYRVTTDGTPGHNIITLPWWFFDGTPRVGDQMEFIWDYNVYNLVQWQIHKQKTK